MRHLASILILVIGIFMVKQATPQKFPTIEAETLSQKKVVFPEITQGKYALILIAFKRQTQGQVDSWLDPFIEEFGDKEKVTFYEIPMISNNWKWMSSWIDSGMRSGVPEYKHDNVATYYGPLTKYFEYFGIENSKLCYTFLLNEVGEIIWRGQGAASEEAYNEMRNLVKENI